MRPTSPKSSGVTYRSIAICGNPNSGKTTIFNAITGLSQKVGNYPGVTVEKVVGQFSLDDDRRYELVDIPGTYSLSAFSPDEYIAASALYGGIDCERLPDALICVVDATNLERGLYLVQQILQVGRPMVVALNMSDVAQRRGIRIDTNKLTQALGGIPVVAVVGNRRRGIDLLKATAAAQADGRQMHTCHAYDPDTEQLIDELQLLNGARTRTRAEYLRITLDVDGPAERKFIAEVASREVGPDQVTDVLAEGRARIRKRFGTLSAAETMILTRRASEISREIQTDVKSAKPTRSEVIDRFLLHPVLGPILLVLMMTIVFQSIFSWAEPFMNLIDAGFGSLAEAVGRVMAPGPLKSLVTDGIVGGVGSVLIFLPQIAILFMFIALLEDSGYMARAAFLVDRMFRWCGLSGKSFIPMLSSFACAIPGIMATRTIEDRKLRFITIMVAPLMTCSARLPVYAIMIAAFVPHQTYLGLFNLQGMTLTLLYLLGILVAVAVSFVLQKTIFKTERGTFIMEMPSYKIPTLSSVLVRVANRVKSFLMRAGTVIFAITIIIWALSYYPHSDNIARDFARQRQAAEENYTASLAELGLAREQLLAENADATRRAEVLAAALGALGTQEEILRVAADAADLPADIAGVVAAVPLLRLQYEAELSELSNNAAGTFIRDSYFARVGQAIEPVFHPLGWDWRVTMAVMASFPAREVIIATLGTIFNLGTDSGAESTTLVEKMRQATWESGPRQGEPLFSPAVALSIVVFFALCCQCGATLVTIKHETNSWYIPIWVFLYMTSLAYVLGVAVYQVFKHGGLG
ncbi:MAG: ferrous iron transport protein B [bacterium]